MTYMVYLRPLGFLRMMEKVVHRVAIIPFTALSSLGINY
ncbi:unnamed protein product [Brassica rapa subsp. trilocularis]